MNIADERIAWALQFDQMDLGNLSTQDMQNLRIGFSKFLYPWHYGRQANKEEAALYVAKGVRIFTQQGNPPLFPERGGISDEFMEKLDDVHKATGAILRGSVAPTPDSIVGTINFSVLPEADGSPKSLLFIAPERESFLLHLCFLLTQPDISPILTCPACGKMFQRIRKQKYCSAQCTKRANMRAWRQTQKGKATSQKQTRKRYERLVQKKTPGAQPQRYRKRKTVSAR